MIQLRFRHGALPAALVIAVGFCAHAGAAPPTMVLSPGKKLAFDFSGSPNGGVPGGTFDNFAFVLDLNEPAQKLIVRTGQQRKNVAATYDYADCSKNQESLLERTVGGLGPGTATFVDYMDIEMIPTKQKNLVWSGGVCFGYRTTTGWHWNLTSTPLVYDATAKLLRGRIWVKQPDVDALKLVFDHSVPSQPVRSVKVTTQPVQLNIVKKPSGADTEAALAALRADTQEWWAEVVARDPDNLEEGEEPATADAEGLRRFLESRVLTWFETRRKELANRPSTKPCLATNWFWHFAEVLTRGGARQLIITGVRPLKHSRMCRPLPPREIWLPGQQRQDQRRGLV